MSQETCLNHKHEQPTRIGMCERIQVLVYTFSTQQPLLPFGHLHARAWGFFVLLKAISVDIVAEKWLIFAPGCSLSAGRAVSILPLQSAKCGFLPKPFSNQQFIRIKPK
ncbi:hypothetical protein AB986_12250 [Alkalihalobacillus macyae]|uniref:Uncharacterized protein n=1 Tax=Guptibacillus hwajinpoensis TaxID=208199 RepID=A0A0J6CUH4_9BACL|nr:hypothetical protein AB986_12250 [Alkalihalobacillus macyae]